MHRRRLSFTESDSADIQSCSDIQTLNGGDEMIFAAMNEESRGSRAMNTSRQGSLVSGDAGTSTTGIITVDLSTPLPRHPPDYLDGTDVPAVGFANEEPPEWPELSVHADEFPSLAAAQANAPDQFPPLMRSTTSPTATDEEHGGDEKRPHHVHRSKSPRHSSRSPPRTIMIGRDQSRSRHRSLSRVPPHSTKLHDNDDGYYLSMWNTRLCGMRADRLIVLLAMILFAAVAVVVAAIIYSNQMVPTNNNATANTADELSLTRTPIASPLAVLPVGGTPTNAPIFATALDPTLAPITSSPTGAPTQAPTTWPREQCGVDTTDAEFPVDDSFVDCAWVAASADKSTVCAAGNPAHYFCRETCENCNVDDPWPSQVCGVDSPLAQIYAGTGAGTQNCEWVREMFSVQGKRLCESREFAYHACRETCGNCGPLGLWPTLAPTVAPVVANIPVVSPTPPPTAIEITATPVMQPVTATITPTVGSEPSEPASLPTTSPPTTAETTRSAPDMESIIVDAYPVAAARLDIDTSPQSAAVQWMEEAFDEGAYLNLSNGRLLQIFALATFAFSTNIDQWNNKENWLDWSVDECQWYGITCENRSVVAIDLSSNGLDGTLAPEITFLQDSLRVLVLSSNAIGGYIPFSIGNLLNLEELRIDRNKFSGTLPTSIGRMRSLRLFYLEHNPSIHGRFPVSVLDMDNLEELVFYYTAISEITDEVCDLNLQTLIFDCKQIPTTTCWTRCFYLCGGNTGILC